MQLVSRRLHTISRDNELWKAQCFEASSWESLRWRRELLRRQGESTRNNTDIISDEAGHGELPSDVAQTPALTQNQTVVKEAMERTRILANWDPSYPGENIDWYSDYIHRKAPITISWLQQPRNQESSEHEHIDVCGSGVYNPPGEDESSITVAPLDDGSICLWDLSSTSERKGRIIGRSAPRTLSHSGVSQSGAEFPKSINNTGITECISIDNIRRRAYVAVQCGELFFLV